METETIICYGVIQAKDRDCQHELEEYTISRVAHYYYELTHKTDGVIRKYRTQEGARRAAERHKKGMGYQPKRKASEKRIDAAFKFQAPQESGRSNE